MSRPSTALHSWPVPGSPHQIVRLHPPARGKRSWRITFQDRAGKRTERTFLDREVAHDFGRRAAQDLVDPSICRDRSKEPVSSLIDYYMTDFAVRSGWKASYRAERAGSVRLVPDWFRQMLVCDWTVSVSDRVFSAARDAGYPEGSRQYERLGTVLTGLVTAGQRAGFIHLAPDRPSPMTNMNYRQTYFARRTGKQRASHANGNLAKVPYAHVRAVPAAAIPSQGDLLNFTELAHQMSPRMGWDLHARLLASTGMRLGESFRFTAEDIDWERSRILVTRQVVEIKAELSPDGSTLLTEETPKNGYAREVWFPPTLTPALRSHVDRPRLVAPLLSPAEEPVFLAPEGGFERPSNWRKRVYNPISTALAWPKDTKGRLYPSKEPDDRPRQHLFWRWPPHSLRHFAATWMLKDLCWPPVEVAEQLGHRDSAFTERLYLDHTRSSSTRQNEAFKTWSTSNSGAGLFHA